MRVKQLQEPVVTEPPRQGEDANDCVACGAPDEAYIWVNERWRVRTMDRPSGLPVVLILETRSHLDLGDLPNLLAAELGVMTVRLERAIRSLDGVARVHVNRWGDGSAHMHLWFLARPYGMLQLRGTFLSLWDDILPAIPESRWRENMALVAAWLAEFGGRPLAEPPRFEWQTPSNLADQATAETAAAAMAPPAGGVPVPRPRDGGSKGSDDEVAVRTSPASGGSEPVIGGAGASVLTAGATRADPRTANSPAAATAADATSARDAAGGGTRREHESGWEEAGWEDPEPDDAPLDTRWTGTDSHRWGRPPSDQPPG